MTSDLVIFGEDWGRHPSSTQHLARRLAGDRRVVWINSIGMRRPRMTGRDLKRMAGKAMALAGARTNAVPARHANSVTPLPETLSVMSATAVPWPGSSLAFGLNQLLIGRQVRRHLAARQISKPILWTSLPTALSAVGRLGERAVVYYCGDDFGALAGVDHAPVLEMERRLAAKADLVLAASPPLAARFPIHKTLLLPHGADVELFAKPAARATDLPMSTRIAGFYGSISNWIDVALIAASARAMPDWLFVLVGNVETDISQLSSMDNVRLIGARPHADLPGYVQHWDVSLLPFVDCAQIHACNPLKLREYLAAGTPVAATAFPALHAYLDLVETAKGTDGFVAAIRRAAEDRPRNSARRARVAGETWECRAQQVSEALAAL